MRFVVALAFGVLVAAQPAGAAPTAADLCTPRVLSSREIAVDFFNARAVSALAAGEDWARDPLRTALACLQQHGDGECSTTAMLMDKPPGEGCHRVRITIVRDGFLDDSIRGDWTQFDLVRSGETWTVARALRAQRCWRSADPEAYVADPCP